MLCIKTNSEVFHKVVFGVKWAVCDLRYNQLRQDRQGCGKEKLHQVSRQWMICCFSLSFIFSFLEEKLEKLTEK